MAGNLSDYLENKLLDHALGTTAFTMPSPVYLALYTSATTDAGGGTEVTGGGYARQPVTFSAAAGGSKQNLAVTWPAASAAWSGPVTHVAVRDALTGGNLLFHGPLAAQKSIASGESFQFAAGALTAALD
jgi:hypothetical protein